MTVIDSQHIEINDVLYTMGVFEEEMDFYTEKMWGIALHPVFDVVV